MNEKEFDYMNVIPLVDVMLVLLTIVLTTSSFIASGMIPVDLPQTEKGSVKNQQHEQEIIEINRQGEVFFSSKKVSIEELKKKVGELSQDTEILIRADREISLQIFVSVLETVKQQGLEKILLQTEVSR